MDHLHPGKKRRIFPRALSVVNGPVQVVQDGKQGFEQLFVAEFQGVGFFLLAGLVLGVGADLVKANALKVFIVLIYTSVALVIFLINRQVDLRIGLILAAGNMIGAWIGSRTAVSWGPKFVRVVLLLAISVSAMKLLGLIDLVINHIGSVR